MKGDGFTRREVTILVVAIIVVFVGGTAGFMYLLHESWHEALYRTIVTASLTGLDSTPHGLGAELLTIGVVLSGVAIFGYFAAQIFDSIAHSVLGGAWREKKRRNMIDQLRNHIIVCGYGRVGRRAGEELREAGVPYVVLDFGEEALEHARQDDVLYVDGSGSEDDDLLQAGLERARGILVASDDDGDNLYITLSVKSRRPDVIVIARGSSEEAERKLKLAGADRVVTPYTTAGRVMAQLMIKPQVTSFVNAMISSEAPDLNFEEIEVTSSCGAAGQTIGELSISSRTGANIVAVRKQDGALELRPTKDTLLEESDVIVGLGSPAEIKKLEEMFERRDILA
ncbi:MAG TPA: NAD-binding protein [Gaiellaceae bacterium]|jgi:voltage-gated potassium channel|nr:NAD-binding protein [Gaiellaceae bacterium]